MSTSLLRLGLVVAAFMLGSAFSVQQSPLTNQPSDERKAQEALPKSGDPIWNAFNQCKVHYNDKTHKYSITYTPEVKAMEGKPLTVSGFMLPLETTEKFNHFLISKRTPTCPYCPPGEPNEIAEVFTTKPVKYTEGVLIVTGTFKFTTNHDMGLFFKLENSSTMDNQSFKPKFKMPTV